MYDNLPTYRGHLVRHPAPSELAIDPQPFGYLDDDGAYYRRRYRASDILPPRGYTNSEARKRLEEQPEHACYAPHGEHAT